MDAGVPAQPSPQPPPSTAAVVAAGGGGLKRPRPTAGSNSSNTTTTIKIASANVSDETRASNLRAPVTPPNTGTTSNSTTGSSTPTTTTSSSINTDNINRRNAELNDLLQLSASHEVNFAMTSDAIVVALAEVVLLDCLQWNSTLTTKNNNNNNNNGDLETSSDNKDDDTTSMRLFRSAKAWTTPPTPLSQAWAEHCCQYSFSHSTTNNEKEENNTVVAICEAIAMILRNFSFTGANLRLLAYSPDVLHTLTAFLYIGTKNKSYRQLRRSSSSNNNNNSSNSPDSSTSSLVLTSLQTLLNVARYLDVTGQQLLKDKLFYDGTNTAAVEGPAVPNASEYGKCVTGAWNGFGIGWLAKRLDTKEDSIENVPTELLLSLTEDYLEAVWSIFPALHAVFVVDNTNQPSRAVFLVTLKLLQELINTARVGLVGAVQDETLNLLPGQEYKIPNIRSVLVNVPDAMLEKLSDLLFVPRHGPDSLE